MELGLSVLPPITAHTHTIIFLHGRGDTARNVADTLFWSRDSYRRSLKDIFPSVRWVFPQSEVRPCEREGDDAEEWSQWFDIWNPLDFSDREEVQAPGLRESVLSVRRLVAREARSVGGLSRVVLAGISQGAATAVHVLLNLPLDGTQLPPSPAIATAATPPDELDAMAMDDDDDDDDDDASLDAAGDSNAKTTTTATTPPARLAAFVGFACWMPFPGGTLDETREILALPGGGDGGPEGQKEEEEGPPPSDEVVRRTPVLLSHCADDAVVFVEYGKQLRVALQDFGVRDVAWREYEDGGHWINSPRGVDDLVEFLRAQGLPAALPPRPYAGSISMSPD